MRQCSFSFLFDGSAIHLAKAPNKSKQSFKAWYLIKRQAFEETSVKQISVGALSFFPHCHSYNYKHISQMYCFWLYMRRSESRHEQSAAVWYIPSLMCVISSTTGTLLLTAIKAHCQGWTINQVCLLALLQKEVLLMWCFYSIGYSTQWGIKQANY